MVVHKAYQMLGLIRRHLYHAPTRVKRIAYDSLVRPHLDYACEVWDPHTSTLCSAVEAVQNKALRFIYSVRQRIESMSQLRDKFEWATLSARRRHMRMIVFHKAEHGRISHTIPAIFYRNRTTNGATTRWLKPYEKPYAKNLAFYHSFWVRTIREIQQQ